MADPQDAQPKGNRTAETVGTVADIAAVAIPHPVGRAAAMAVSALAKGVVSGGATPTEGQVAGGVAPEAKSGLKFAKRSIKPAIPAYPKAMEIQTPLPSAFWGV